jgi:RimJ/RimL family protein N-acetyltransferase
MLKKNQVPNPIFLDSFQSTDSKMLHKIHNQSKDRKLALAFSLPVSDSSTEDWLRKRLKRLEKFPESIYWALRNEQEILLGYSVLYNIDYINSNAEVGIYLAECRRTGLGKQALKLTLAKAFEDLGLHKVLARVVDSNVAAVQLFETFGFKQEGKITEFIKTNGSWQSLYLYTKKS